MSEQKCIIITAYLEGTIRELVDITENDIVLCADAGYELALREGVRPTVIIGDFDSAAVAPPDDIPRFTFPSHKDLTDTGLCLEYALEQGCTNVLILGGLGGQFDHSMANVQNMVHFTRRGMSVMLMDDKNILMVLENGRIEIPPQPGRSLSIVSLTERSEGVTILGTEYTVEDYTLTSDFPLAVRNVFLESDALVEVRNGTLLIILSKL